MITLTRADTGEPITFARNMLLGFGPSQYGAMVRLAGSSFELAVKESCDDIALLQKLAKPLAIRKPAVWRYERP